MNATLWFFAVALGIVGYPAYRYYDNWRLERGLQEWLGEPMPGAVVDPEFGTLLPSRSIVGISWEAAQRLDCSELGILDVSIGVGEPKLTNIERENIRLLKSRWPELWGAAFGAIKGKMIEYGHQYVPGEEKPIVGVGVPDERWTAKSEWVVSLTFEPAAGEYSAHMRGFTEVIEVPPPF